MKKLKLNVNRLFRGGYWNSFESFLRAADRCNNSPSYLAHYIGPRFVRGKR